GVPGLEAFEEAALTDPAVRDLLPRIRVAVDSGLAAAYPARWGVRVEGTRADGSVVRASRDGATGDPEHPLDDRAVDHKVEGLLRWSGCDACRSAAALAACRSMVAGGPPVDLLLP